MDKRPNGSDREKATIIARVPPTRAAAQRQGNQTGVGGPFLGRCRAAGLWHFRQQLLQQCLSASSNRSMPRLTALGIGLCLLAWASYCVSSSLAAPVSANDTTFERTCNYTASNVSSELFFNSSNSSSNGGPAGTRFMFLFPLEHDEPAVRNRRDKPWEACFNAAEPYDIDLIRQGKKLPCFYSQTAAGMVSYWEEHACEEVIKTNCYCYALNRYMGSWCTPGFATLEEPEPREVSCDFYVKGTIADGGKQVDRQTVYSKTPTGFYVALGVRPGIRYGDYHFWRLDSDNSWSNKPGIFMPRRTYGPNQTLVIDVEVAEQRGVYSIFCGYFEVDPKTHELQGNGYWDVNIPGRVRAWKDAGIQVNVKPLDRISEGWKVAYKNWYGVPINPAVAADATSSNMSISVTDANTVERIQKQAMDRIPSAGGRKLKLIH